MVVGHGWHKFSHFADVSAEFAEKLGIPPVMTGLAITAEVVCASLVVIGLATRWNALPLVIAMGIAVCTAQASNPLFTGPGVVAAKEPALMYLVSFLTIVFTGAGRFSVDACLDGTCKTGHSAPQETAGATT